MGYSRNDSNRRGYRERSGGKRFSSNGGYNGGSYRVSSNSSKRKESRSFEKAVVKKVIEALARGEDEDDSAQETEDSEEYLIEGWFPTSDQSPIRKKRDGFHTVSQEPAPFDSRTLKRVARDFKKFGTIPEQCILLHKTKESVEEEARRMKANGHTNIQLHQIQVTMPPSGIWEINFRSLTKAGESIGWYRDGRLGHQFLVEHYIDQRFVQHDEPFLG